MPIRLQQFEAGKQTYRWPSKMSHAGLFLEKQLARMGHTICCGLWALARAADLSVLPWGRLSVQEHCLVSSFLTSGPSPPFLAMLGLEHEIFQAQALTMHQCLAAHAAKMVLQKSQQGCFVPWRPASPFTQLLCLQLSAVKVEDNRPNP